jgi:hypothetical protein
MKTKDITKATEPGNHYDDVAIFRLESSRRLNWSDMVRLMKPEEYATLRHGYQHRNKNKPSYISVVHVQAIDANGQPQEFGDNSFKGVAVRDRVSASDGSVITDTVHVSQISCCMNESESIITVWNDLLERLADAEAKRERDIANSAAERARNEALAADIAKRITALFGGYTSPYATSRNSSALEVSLVHLQLLVEAAESVVARVDETLSA